MILTGRILKEICKKYYLMFCLIVRMHLIGCNLKKKLEKCCPIAIETQISIFATIAELLCVSLFATFAVIELI